MSAARGINVRWYESVDHWAEGVCKIVFEVGVSLQVMQDINTLRVSSFHGGGDLVATYLMLKWHMDSSTTTSTHTEPFYRPSPG